MVAPMTGYPTKLITGRYSGGQFPPCGKQGGPVAGYWSAPRAGLRTISRYDLVMRPPGFRRALGMALAR